MKIEKESDMPDEFDRIMEFFSLPPKEKEAHLQTVFEDSVEYFERFKHILLHGTPEEKQKAMERVAILKRKIEEETKQICEKTGLTEEQLSQYSNNSKNFTDEQWHAIESAKEKLEEGVSEVKKMVGKEKSAKEGTPSTEGIPKKKKRPPKTWISS